MTHVISLCFAIAAWQRHAMQDGYTLQSTVIHAQQVPNGYLPAFTGADGTRIIVRLNHPLPTEQAARNCLRDVLWAAHSEQRICLLPHPLTPVQEQAA
ncbi:hypothetical protein [Vreelandella nanhaiensis]|uniref:Uncharacterized protein n=1 Tax=Vreelandella nanhaiensis TaxID=1258546 RepID=A0A433KY87_9GAMM|nr:hypothetical protein [Halomonas nanhaiensis]RUR34503.1 hypothetical protein ELY38_02620 [Halomonas nanhaiensis]